MSRPVEVRWLWRRVYTYAVTVLNCAGIGAVVLRLNYAEALK